MSNSKNVDMQRECVVQILIQVLEEGEMSHFAIRSALQKRSELSKTDRAFITRLSEGTIERVITLDYIINQFSKTKVKKMKPFIRQLLRMSVYQIIYMEQVPDSAVCNEAVKLVKKRKLDGLSGFVNGVLRNISRQKEAIVYPDKQDAVTYASVTYSIPKWLVRQLCNDYGEERMFASFEAMYAEQKNRLNVRVNTSRQSVAEVMNSLIRQGISVEQSLLDCAITIWNYDNLEEIEAFQKGWIQVQDISSMLVGAVSGAKDGDLCIDLCAAPGGKTMHLAELNQTGRIISRDVSEQKINRIRENVIRNGYRNVELLVGDATVYEPSYRELADVVLADVPCSGLGIMAKKNDIKYRITKEGMEELVGLSKQILRQAVTYVRPGGTLIFSTCTMNRKENEDMRQFILTELGMEPADIRKEVGQLLDEDRDATCKDGHLQLFITEKHDGFYVAKFRKPR